MAREYSSWTHESKTNTHGKVCTRKSSSESTQAGSGRGQHVLTIMATFLTWLLCDRLVLVQPLAGIPCLITLDLVPSAFLPLCHARTTGNANILCERIYA